MTHLPLPNPTWSGFRQISASDPSIWKHSETDRIVYTPPPTPATYALTILPNLDNLPGVDLRPYYTLDTPTLIRELSRLYDPDQPLIVYPFDLKWFGKNQHLLLAPAFSMLASGPALYRVRHVLLVTSEPLPLPLPLPNPNP